MTQILKNQLYSFKETEIIHYLLAKIKQNLAFINTMVCNGTKDP